MKTLSREKRIYVLDPSNEPAVTIDSGDDLMVETWDAFEGIRDPQALEEKSLKGPATGPIYVNGAEPGDALRIEFVSINPKENPAHMVMPGRGFLEAEFTEAYPTVMSLDNGHLVLPSGVRLPLRPSMGLVATTPTYIQQTASDSGPYGGDIDMKELVAGSVLYLPVFRARRSARVGRLPCRGRRWRSGRHRRRVFRRHPHPRHRRKGDEPGRPARHHAGTLRRPVSR